MASIKELRLKIQSLKNTNKITSAMKLVATSKLRKAQDAMNRNKPFQVKLNNVLSRVISKTEDSSHPLLIKRNIKKIRFYVYTSDRGLCGSFNNNLLKAAAKQIELKAQQADIEVYTLGKRAFDFFTRKYKNNFSKNYEGINLNISFENSDAISAEAIADFKSGWFDEAYIVHNEFISVLSQKPVCQRVLPISLPQPDQPEANLDYLMEPDITSLLNTLLPKLVSMKFYFSLLENAAGEHGARMTAMENATNNSQDLIDKTTLLMNRVRQAAITTELTEIVAGAESLKG
jgi:F-type H+-transporting ATPase subunit gamma